MEEVWPDPPEDVGQAVGEGAGEGALLKGRQVVGGRAADGRQLAEALAQAGKGRPHLQAGSDDGLRNLEVDDGERANAATEWTGKWGRRQLKSRNAD